MRYLTKLRRVLMSPAAVVPLVVVLLVLAQSLGTIVVLYLLPDAPSSLKLLVIIGVALAALAAVLLSAMRWLGVGWSTFKLQKPGSGWFTVLATGTGAYIAISLTLLVLASYLIPSFNSNQPQDIGLQNPTGIQLLPGFIALVIFTPIFEEIVFRGILFAGLRRKSSFMVAALFSALIFAFLHGQWNVALDTFALGLVLAWLVEKTGSVMPGMILHALKNLIAFGFLFILK